MRLFAKALLASTLAAGATLAFAPAHAELNTPRSVAVRYADLDLKSDAGKARLHKRVAYAAERVCATPDTGSFYSRQSTEDCQQRAIAGAGRAMVQVLASAETTFRVAAN